jgi:pimeloyl-ACP methyl ester carboxylesterase
LNFIYILLITLITLSHSSALAESIVKHASFDDLKLEYIDVGAGDINIVVESGIGMGVNYWQPLLPKLMQLKQRIIIYSRAGNGSSSTAYDVSIEQSNIRLHKLLVSVNAEQNILLVGHSYGGLHVREYAIAYPNTVIGMLLLDPSHEQFSKKLTELDKKWAEKDDKRLDTLLADSQEWKNLQGIYLRAQLGDNGHINQTPTVIITSSKLGESEWWIGHSEQGKKLWRELHTSLIAHNPNSAHIVSNLVGHNIPIDSPNMVIEAINQSIKLTKNLSAQSR